MKFSIRRLILRAFLFISFLSGVVDSHSAEPVAAYNADLSSEGVLTKNEWLMAFSTNFAQMFCNDQKINKFCEKMSVSGCRQSVFKDTQACMKTTHLPDIITPGLSSVESGRMVASCISQKFENRKTKKKSCL